jgi:N-methylhydantoinase A
MLRIGIDTGGTFTDFIIADDKRLGVFKILSTPDDPAQAVLAGLARILGNKPFEVVHGSTVATNALLERKGARTALITTRGFEDVLEIGRQNRPEIYNLMASRPAPLVAAQLRFGVRERTIYTGEIVQSIRAKEVAALGDRLRKRKVESVAVAFLFSFANPENEMAMYRLLKDSGLAISLSHKILPEFREYERTSTTAVNAYLAPVMSKYIGSIYRELKKSTGQKGRPARFLRIMQSNGGSISAQRAIEEPVRTVLSGPAGGVVGAMEMAQRAEYRQIISFDMGGTSTDVCLCPDRIHTTTESVIAGCPIGVPVIDMHTVGAGGGSIARIDVGGALKVGPESAGADPGPICYGKGGREITVTDANLMLGRLDADYFLGGHMKIDAEALRDHFASLAGRLGRRPGHRPKPAAADARYQAAQGIIDIVNANMEKAIRVISVERGHDPRDFTLVTFGGAGGLHACDLARALSIRRILIPKNPGLLSALGVLLSDVVRDYSLTAMLKSEEAAYGQLSQKYRALERRGYDELRKEGFAKKDISSERRIDLRYAGQAFELTVPFSPRYVEDFHAAHEKRYGYADAQRPTEIVTLRVRCTGRTRKPELGRKSASRHRSPRAALVKNKIVYFANRAYNTSVYERERLHPGARIPGPAIIVEYSATTALAPGFIARVDEWENLIVAAAGAQAILTTQAM